MLRIVASVAKSENRSMVKKEDIPNDIVENSKLSDDQRIFLRNS